MPITDTPIQVDHIDTPEIVITGTPIPTDDSVPTPTIDYTQMVGVVPALLQPCPTFIIEGKTKGITSISTYTYAK